MKLQFSRQIFEKHSSIKFNENLLSESRVVPRVRAYGRKKTQRQTDRQTWRS